MNRIVEIETRLSAIKAEIESEGADIDALTKETDTLLEERTKLLEAIETRKSTLAKIASMPHTEEQPKKEEKKAMTLEEIRSSLAYAKAYLTAIKTDDETEVRALLSNNVSGGQIPVPTFLESEIKTAWEENELVNLVKKSYFTGNVKVGFELSAGKAVVHVEGTAAPAEETITLGTVEIKAENIKKWITISDEAIEGTTVDTVGYIYKEIAHQIVAKAEEIIIAKIDAAPATATATAPAVAEYTADTLAEDTITLALAELSGKAKNVYLAMNRKTAAAFKAVSMKAKYAVDVFDGLKDRVVFTDALPAFSAAGAGDTYVIAGDFGYGFQANFPNGNQITIKRDDLSLAEKDLVKIVGKQYVGMAVVATNAFVKIKKAD